MKRILLTGGSGFIGRNLIEMLAPKYTILSPSHKELELVDEDAVNDYFKNRPVDVVVHCAVRPGHRNAKDPSNQLQIDSRMFFNLVGNSDKFQKLIYLGSGAIYDMRYYRPKMKEEDFGNHMPVDEHGLFRYIAAKYIEKTGEDIVELRPFGVFGKYEDYAIRFISNAICKSLFDLPITIKQNRKFDYIFVEDLVRVIDYFINNDGKHRAYNVTPDESVELKVLAEKVLMVAGKNVPIIVAQDGMGLEYSGDNSRLRGEIPGLALTPIDTAIRRLFDWYSSNMHLLNRNLLLFDK